jgi:uncharacterized protein
MKNKTVVIYHSADFDGIFCREIAKHFLPDAELVGWDFGDAPLAIPQGKVYVLDLPVDRVFGYNFALDGIKQVLPVIDFSDFVWIDHHKSSIETHPGDIPGYRIDGVAACRLAWQWFSIQQHNAQHQTNEMMQVPLPAKTDYVERLVLEPYAVQLAGEYDIWDKRNSNAELFQHGLRSKKMTEFDWEQLLDNTVDKELVGTGMEQTTGELAVGPLLQSGSAIQFARTEENASIIKAAGFDIEFEGLKFLACNHARYNSLLFTAGLKPEHDACLGFCWRGGKWVVSLYHAPGKEHHDLSQIAVKYGGGGHRGAAGFRVNSLPFLNNG